MDNPLLIPYLGEACPQCGRVFETPADLQATKFGANARPVHGACWDAYTGEMVQRVRELCESLWSKLDRRGSDTWQVTLTRRELKLLREFVRPAVNRTGERS